MRSFPVVLLLPLVLKSASVAAAPPPPLMQRAVMATAGQVDAALGASEIFTRATRASGGATFVNPGALFLEGYNTIRTADGGEVLWDRYAMWRVFDASFDAAHSANGMVRIEAWNDFSVGTAFDPALFRPEQAPSVPAW